ncbi:siroheme synthase [Schizosaccharomyces cryophilus OY26]|uniref:precorrin-2 dehydrogenase n=1 Tax=Schizosaccharomyces cryophilus (strain OY26 / ATCC MYA-4695 / CBS 11777 / NBRC 106824 / NRRL Y48691) TaxID=653667 RepID=S9W3Q0_SCHCR|nr:siroheme synthase [Schizosaccharomyces cryophilus OY26]EPY53169.1 siroheme synthase [Schizosaccharomyces cryophilus OY26]
MSSEFSTIQPGGSLILAWRIQGKKVLVIGGGAVASGRINHVLNADGIPIVVSPEKGLCKEVEFRIHEKQVEWRNREFSPEDVTDDIAMVLSAVDDPSLSTQIYQLCQSKRIPINAADIPPECDFYFGAEIREGPLQIMVSTNGKGPKLATIIRNHIRDNLPDGVSPAITQTGLLRQKLRELAPTPEMGRKRMRWMIRLCEKWTLNELGSLKEEHMDKLLCHFPSSVPTYKELTRPPPSAFANCIWATTILLTGGLVFAKYWKQR